MGKFRIRTQSINKSKKGTRKRGGAGAGNNLSAKDVARYLNTGKVSNDSSLFTFLGRIPTRSELAEREEAQKRLDDAKKELQRVKETIDEYVNEILQLKVQKREINDKINEKNRENENHEENDNHEENENLKEIDDLWTSRENLDNKIVKLAQDSARKRGQIEQKRRAVVAMEVWLEGFAHRFSDYYKKKKKVTWAPGVGGGKKSRRSRKGGRKRKSRAKRRSKGRRRTQRAAKVFQRS